MGKLTPWFPPEVKPVHVGVYQSTVALDDPDYYRLWNGKEWRCAGLRPEACGDLPTRAGQDIYWRGLSRKPKEKK